MILDTTINYIRTSNRAIKNGSVWGAMLESIIRLISALDSTENTHIVQIP